MSWIIWLLRLFGLNKLAAALEGYKQEVQKEQEEVNQEVITREKEIDEDVAKHKEEIDTMPNSNLNDEFDRVFDAAEQANRDRKSS